MALVVAAAAVVGVLPAAALTAEPAAAATVRAFGSNPFNNILAAADANKQCGLTKNELAVVMMAPVFPEAGGTATLAPSPMTLSRWDKQSALWAFGNPATPYQKAFFHPGIGLWQFDSAGGWNLTAADAINTSIVASVAAKTMADRFCASTASTRAAKRTAAWGPWYGCGPTNCEAIFQDLYNATNDTIRLENLNLVTSVGTKGGMVTRSCLLNGVAVTCSYIDPAAAQGNKAWTAPGFNPATPISAPFYDIAHNGREWRVWLPADTGYGATISADKPITKDARTSLTWSTTAKLCDVTTSRGACGRVATTPWGPFTAEPFGVFDGAKGGIAQLSVWGWTIDPDTSNPIDVDIWVNGLFKGTVRADTPRPDVAANVAGYGQNHGFDKTITGLSAGNHQVCVYAMNVGPTGTVNPLLGCKWVTVAPVPPGPFFDVSGVHPFVDEVQWLVDQGIATGRSDGSFGPTAPVTRGAMAMFLWRAAGSPTASAVPAGATPFSDVAPGHPFAAAIAWLASEQIATGYADGTYRPDAPIARAGVAAFLYRYAGAVRGPAPRCSTAPFVDVGPTHPFCGEIDWLVDEGITTGFGDLTFRPTATVARQAMAAFLSRLLRP